MLSKGQTCLVKKICNSYSCVKIYIFVKCIHIYRLKGATLYLMGNVNIINIYILIILVLNDLKLTLKLTIGTLNILTYIIVKSALFFF